VSIVKKKGFHIFAQDLMNFIHLSLSEGFASSTQSILISTLFIFEKPIFGIIFCVLEMKFWIRIEK